jgi:hypothetical protein
MSTFGPSWCLCGGWAVDAWLGQLTRDHADVDVSVCADDQRVLFDHLAGWQLVAHDLNDTHQPWDGRHLDLPNHIQARFPVAGEQLPDRVDNAGEQGFGLDVQLSDRSGDDWILSRQPRISLPLSRCVGQSGWGLPTLVPEVLLFYKASELRRRDKLDFLALLPHLTDEQRDWLRDAISLAGHPWLAQLS